MGTFREYSLATRVWHRTLLDQSDFEFLRGMPTLKWFEYDGKHFRMAHATPQGDLFKYLSMDEWEDQIVGLDADFILLGHTHVQGVRTFGTINVVNPGSVGLARDHMGMACYATYQDGQIELKRIRYEVARTVTVLRAAPIPEQAIEGLVAILQGTR
jgi:predicted phosphodiesterase